MGTLYNSFENVSAKEHHTAETKPVTTMQISHGEQTINKEAFWGIMLSM